MQVNKRTLWGEDVLSVELKTGATVWVLPKKDARQNMALLAVGGGALHPVPGLDSPGGIAHFIEHCLFEKSTGDITDKFTVLGGDINASTSYSSTHYMLHCSENQYALIELLFELVFTCNWTREQIDKERDIIASEIRLFQDDPEWVGFKSALKNCYGQHALAAEIAGSVDELERIDEKVLAAWHRAYYKPDNMSLLLSGDFEVDAIVDICERAIEKCYIAGDNLPLVAVDRVPTLPVVGGVERLKLPVSNPQLYIAYADKPRSEHGRQLLEREMALELMLDIAFGPASLSFSQWYESGLISGDSFSCDVFAEPLFSFSLFSSETPDPDFLASEIDRVLYEMKKSGDWRKDLPRAKRKAYGRLVRSFESAENCVDLMYAATNCGMHPFDYIEVCNAIGAAEIEECLQESLQVGEGGMAFIYPNDEEN